MSRVFLSHSSRDSRQAIAVKAWLVEQEPGLAEEIFLDLDPHTGIRPGERWKQALQQANTRCEAVICLLSKHWAASHECTDRIPLCRDAEQDHPVRPVGAVARYRDHLGVAALRPVCRRRPDRRDRGGWRGAGGVVQPGFAAAAGRPARPGHRGRAFPVAAAGRSGPGPVPGVGSIGGGRCGGVLRARRPDPARAGCAARDARLGGAVPVRDPGAVGGREVVVSAGGPVAPAAPRRPPIPAAAHRAPRTRGAHRRTRARARDPPAARRSGLAAADAGGDQDRLPTRPGGAVARLVAGGPAGSARPAARCARR